MDETAKTPPSVEEALAALQKAKEALAQIEAAKAVAAPESETVKESTVVKAKKVPVSGQSGSLRDVPIETLNDKEKAVLARLNGSGKGARQTITISVLAMETNWTVSPESEAQANSWVRNCLRRLFLGSWVDKPKRGSYQISAKGRKRLKDAG